MILGNEGKGFAVLSFAFARTAKFIVSPCAMRTLTSTFTRSLRGKTIMSKVREGVPLTSLVLVLHAAATWFMTGLIWFVQVVHYPLYDRVGSDAFVAYERIHCSLTTMVVAPVMIVELLSAVLLLFQRPRCMHMPEAALNLALLGLIWLSTLFIADQLHGALASQFSQEAHRALVGWNWLRTAAWSLRAVLLAAVVCRGLNH
ncbi:MAG: hypothetical protein JNN26_23150 [Candidatus Obscuribacter sp.]|nr:hypothetical protein [Candidatus Obscuribacter sp.]